MNGGYPILLVEDSPDDVLLIERVFNRADFNHPLRTVTDGEKAIEYLKGLEEYSDRAAYPYPGLVILDLKMPGLGGFDVIRWMRGHPQAKLVPIIVISGSSEPADVNRAYELGANAFMVKPANHRALEQLLSTIGEFWLASEGPRPGFSARSSAAML
jgi:CheY-like chemotaxis protein